MASRWVGRSRGVSVRPLGRHHRDGVLEFLRRSPRDDLFLLDLVAGFGETPPPGEPAAELLGAWGRDRLLGVASLRPSLALASRSEPDTLAAWVPIIARLQSGLIKSASHLVDPLWNALRERGFDALVDRDETAYAVDCRSARLREPGRDLRVRPAGEADLPVLVAAARASLREESRPDPAREDPEGFRRWVRARIARARVVERQGRVVFAGYADVRRREGWLLQGIYTFPEQRRRGVAAAGVSALCHEAFRTGAEHVQLAVVDGNRAGERLYASLGFTPFAALRTVLFN